jgi:hypothetical protein
MKMESIRLRIPALALAHVFAAAAAVLSAQAGALRDNLGMFFTLGAQDSVVAVTQKSPTALEIEVVDPSTSERRTLQEEVGAKPMSRLLASAQSEGVTVNAAPAAAAETPRVREAAAEPERPAHAGARSLSSQRKNRLLYMTTQVPLSTWVYGLSIPLALDVDNARVIVAMPLLVAPISFGAHFWFAKSHDFEDAHLEGTNYLSTASLYLSYALPFAFLDWSGDNTAYRTAAFLSLAAYPAGIWAGYQLGDRYVDMPGRVATQSNFALSFGILGFFSPFLYFEHPDDKIEDIVRLGLGQSVAFATAGHFLASYYRTGENIPGGVTIGILNHAALGAGLGAEIAALSDASTVRPWVGAALAGGTVGFMEGLWYFRQRYDTKERGYYNSVGTMAGALMGGGILILTDPGSMSPQAAKITVVSSLLGGALVGYIATDLLTRGMEERTGMTKPSWTDRVAVNLFPFPEAQVHNRDLYYRYHIPGVTLRF